MVSPNPFTPQSGWEPRFFSGRDRELEYFKGILTASSKGRANHMVLLGEWGTGKTSLLKQYKKMAQGQGCLASFCPISKINSKSFLKDTINLISQEVLLNLPTAGEIETFKSVISKNNSLEPQVKFTKFLIELWSKIKTEVAVILLDDIQNFNVDSGVIDTLRSVLSKDEILNNTNYLFVLSGTPRGWEAFVDKHDPVGRFFRKRVYVENFTKEETFNIINASLKDTSVSFDVSVKDKIYKNSLGHPYEVQLLCSYLYEAQIEGVVSDNIFDKVLKNALIELGRDYFEALYRRASERETEILSILAENNKPLSISRIRSIMITEKRAKSFPVANIKNFLYRLNDKELIKRKENDEFEISDPMFLNYLNLFKYQNN